MLLSQSPLNLWTGKFFLNNRILIEIIGLIDSDEYKFSLLTKQLISIHKEYSLEKMETSVVWEDEEKGILCYQLSSSTSLLLVVVNVSHNSYGYNFIVS